MAYADYWLCDVCGSKSFYDANLHYEDDAPTRPDDGRMLPVGTGDMAAICVECAKTHKIVVQMKTAAATFVRDV